MSDPTPTPTANPATTVSKGTLSPTVLLHGVVAILALAAVTVLAALGELAATEAVTVISLVAGVSGGVGAAVAGSNTTSSGS